MRIAVTGGTGYLGAQSVAALRRDGHEVRLLMHPAEAERPLSSYGVEPAGVDVVEGDVADPTAVAELLEGAEALLHMAGIVAVDDRREAEMWRGNVDATKKLGAGAGGPALDPPVPVLRYLAPFPPPPRGVRPDTPPP